MNLFSGFKSYTKAFRESLADDLDRKLTRKALRRSPDSPVLLGKVTKTWEVQALLSRGWVLRDTVTSTWGELSLYLMEKPNPQLTSAA